MSALSAGVMKGIGGGIAPFGEASGRSLAAIGNAAVSGAVGSAVGQGVGLALGLQDKFSWAGVAAAGMAGAVGQGLGGSLPGLSGRGAVRSFGNIAAQTGVGAASLMASAATRSALEGSSFGGNIMAGLPDVIGQVVGRAIGSRISDPVAREMSRNPVQMGGAALLGGTPSQSRGKFTATDIGPDWAKQFAGDYRQGLTISYFDAPWLKGTWADRAADWVVSTFNAARLEAISDEIVVTANRLVKKVRSEISSAADAAIQAALRTPSVRAYQWADRKYQVTTRALGAAQAVGGVVEVVVGGVMITGGVAAGVPSLGTSTLVVAGGGAVGLMGVDNVQAGVRAVWSGRSTDTVGAQVISATTGLSPTNAELAYGGVQLVTGVGAGAGSRSLVVRGLGATEAAVPGITANRIAGDTVRDLIAAREAPALVEQSFTTVGGVRRVDVLKLGDDLPFSIESKVGRTALGIRERQELARDWWLLRQNRVSGVRWEFSPSGVNGGVGPTPALQEKLNKLGFKTRINR